MKDPEQSSPNFIFGIYPGGMTGTETGLTTGLPDDPIKITVALKNLQGTNPFIVRAYLGYVSSESVGHSNPVDPIQYLSDNRRLDLVLCFRSENEDLTGWKEFIRTAIQKYGPFLDSLQITEEANVDLPALDGHYKHSRRALVQGVIEAKKEIRKCGLAVKVGFNATPDFSPSKTFWSEIASHANEQFYDALDYVGLDFFPDVFRPIAADGDAMDLSASIKYILHLFRDDLATAGIDKNLPLHITENGWPTSSQRTERQQALMLRRIIHEIHRVKDEFNITHYELFALRDADSAIDDIFYQFGIMKDDYSPKEAFHVYKSLIAELTRHTVTH